jgi:hypothetical protein
MGIFVTLIARKQAMVGEKGVTLWFTWRWVLPQARICLFKLTCNITGGSCCNTQAFCLVIEMGLEDNRKMGG